MIRVWSLGGLLFPWSLHSCDVVVAFLPNVRQKLISTLTVNSL